MAMFSERIVTTCPQSGRKTVSLLFKLTAAALAAGQPEVKRKSEKTGRMAGVKNKGLRRESSLCPQFENQCALAVAKVV